jgi:hypothetical protein
LHDWNYGQSTLSLQLGNIGSGCVEKVEKTVCVGWREWVALPRLGIPAIKAKVDTGARTSALHTFNLETYRKGDRLMVRFRIHPMQRSNDIELRCEAAVKDQRVVRDSGGHAEERYVIETLLHCGNSEWMIELTLTNRDDMLFRMLLGRTALQTGGLQVDPAASYLTGSKPARVYVNSA